MKTTFFLIIAVCLTVILEITAQTQNVTIDQRNGDNQQVGALRKWEGTNFTDPPFSPGTWFPFPLNSQQTILGDQSLISYQKYLIWRRNFSFNEPDVLNHHTFVIQSNDFNFTSRLEPSYNLVKIKNSLEGTSLDGGKVEFADPWFIDYPDPNFPKPGGGYYERNRGMK